MKKFSIYFPSPLETYEYTWSTYNDREILEPLDILVNFTQMHIGNTWSISLDGRIYTLHMEQIVHFWEDLPIFLRNTMNSFNAQISSVSQGSEVMIVTEPFSEKETQISIIVNDGTTPFWQYYGGGTDLSDMHFQRVPVVKDEFLSVWLEFLNTIFEHLSVLYEDSQILKEPFKEFYN